MLCMQEEGDDNAVYTRGRHTIALCLHYDNAVDILCSHYDSTVLTRRETMTHTHELNV